MDTQTYIQQLEQRIAIMEEFINSLKNSATIPADVDGAFRARFGGASLVATSIDSTTSTTTVTDTNGANPPTNYTVPSVMAGFLYVTYNGNTIKIPRY